MNIVNLYNENQFDQGVFTFRSNFAQNPFTQFEPVDPKAIHFPQQKEANLLFHTINARIGTRFVWSCDYRLGYVYNDSYRTTNKVFVASDIVSLILQIHEHLYSNSMAEFVGEIDFDYDHFSIRLEYATLFFQGEFCIHIE